MTPGFAISRLGLPMSNHAFHGGNARPQIGGSFHGRKRTGTRTADRG
jgi:hypothetical protein